MKRHLLLMAGLVIGAGLVARAQEKADGAAEPHGRIVRDTPEALRVQDMTMEELQQRLGEWGTGKREDRDGYIVLNQMWFNHKRRKTTETEAGQQINKQRAELLAKHPEFGRLKDFRLSDRIRYQKMVLEKRTAATQVAKPWVPEDKTPRRIIGQGKKAVAIYQFRLEFLRLPNDVELRPEPTAKTVLKLYHNGAQVSPSELTSWKTISYKNRFEVVPRYPDQVARNFLVCSDLIHAEYQAMTQEEREVMQARGNSRVMPWRNPNGNIDQACDVLSLDGERVFSFPIIQQMPKQLAAPLGMTSDGTKAAILIGEKIESSTSYGKTTIIGNPREVLVWSQDAGLKRVKISNKSMSWNDLIVQFEQGKF